MSIHGDVLCHLNAQAGAAAEQAASFQAAQLSPLALAYMGDTIYDLYVRTLLLHSSDATAHGLHLMAASRVCAAAQAEASARVFPLLNEQEQSVYRRGRNAHMGTVPKNASIADYRAATGLESVIGFLYLSGNDARLSAIMCAALNASSRQEP